MNIFSRKRLISLLIMLVLVLQCCAAWAEPALLLSDSVVYTYSNGALTPAATLPKDTLVDRVAENNGVSMITLNGATGFIQTSALGVMQNCGGATAYATADLPMYQSHSAASAIVTYIPGGAAVSVAGIAGSWAGVVYNGVPGFVDANLLTQQAPQQQPAQSERYTAYACVNGAKVYNASGTVIGTVPLNTEVIVQAVQNGLCLVERGGYTAIMLQSELSTALTEPPVVEQTPAQPANGVTFITPVACYVAVNGAKVYDASGHVLGSLPVNTMLTMDAYNDTLVRVSNGSAVGLMFRSDVSSEPVEVPQQQPAGNGITWINPTTYYANTANACVYTASGTVICRLPQNFAVTVSAYNDTLALVSNAGASGFMFLRDLSAAPVSAVQPQPTVQPTVQPTAAPSSPEFGSSVTTIAPTTFYVQRDGAPVANASGTTIATLPLNTAVTVDAYTDSLARVSNGSTVGFMLRSDLGTSKVPVTLKYGDTGDAVKKIQTRLLELGYFTGSIGGNYLTLTTAAVTAFQQAHSLPANGVCDEATLNALFSDGAKKNPYQSSGSGSSSSGSSSSGSSGSEVEDIPPAYPNGSSVQPATGTAIAMDWWTSDIQKIFSRGTTAVVTDVATGIAWRETRSGGTNHADVQPTTAADTAAMKRAVGSWSWNRRAIFVTINGVNYAASMNCMPHGSGSITNNNFDGHHCIHFTNSRTHGTNSVCKLHQAAIQKAAAATL